jgi:hypothetical protein
MMQHPFDATIWFPLAAIRENKALIPVVAVVAAILLGMFMGRRSRRPGAKASWWVGLVVLLVFLSLFFSYTSVRFGDQVEVRVANQPATLSDARENLQDAMREIKERTQEGMHDLKEAIGSAVSQHPASERQKNKSGTRNVMTVNVPKPPLPPRIVMNAVPKQWTVRVDGDDRSKDPSVVTKRIWEKGLSQVQNWVREEIPGWDRAYCLDLSALKRMNVFPEGIKQEEVIDELPGGETETMYRGAATLVLTPEMQKNILTEQWNELQSHLQEQMLHGQGVVLMALLAVTLGAAVLGGYRTYRHWLRTRLVASAPLQQ